MTSIVFANIGYYLVIIGTLYIVPASSRQRYRMSDSGGNESEDSDAHGRTGLATPFATSGKGKVRQAAKKMPERSGKIWATVSVVFNDKAYTTSPEVVCKDCKKAFSGGATRVKQHIMKWCTCTTSELKDLKVELLREADSFAEKNKKKRVCKEMEQETSSSDKRSISSVTLGSLRTTSDVSDAAALSSVAQSGIFRQPPTVDLINDHQRNVASMLNAVSSETMDDKIADFIYGCALPFNIVESPQFKDLLKAAQGAPTSYKLPVRHRFAGDILERSVKRLKADEQPIRDSCTVHGCTIVSDGWDDVERNHLINFLCSTTHGSFFDGTIKLSSEDKEDATAVAALLSDEIERVGALKVVQVVTDTCAVMKAAWKIVEKKYPWITCTCCAAHVLSLLLKDMAKIPEVAALFKKVSKVLNRFRGRKRWCRTKLREVVQKNHGKEIGLYRAADTRFAGKVKEMGRMLRLKADLKYVVDLPEYAALDFRKGRGDSDDTDLDGEGGVKTILLDEQGFWNELVVALKIMVPVAKTLRLCDGNLPVMGKIYDRMFQLGSKVSGMDAPWASKAADLVNERWEYLHSFMHAAGYAFDPEFFEHRKDWDEAVTNGVMEMIERICLRKAILESSDPSKARDELTVDSPVVVSEVAACEVELSTFTQGLGIFSKEKVRVNAKILAPAAWWEQYCKHLPRLSFVAKSVLAQVVNSSAAERNWSIYGRVKSKNRATMGHSKSDKAVYCHEAIMLKNKLQVAAYEPNVQPWEELNSESDSDASDESDLMA